MWPIWQARINRIDDSSWKLPIAGSDTDWREFRAKLVSAQNLPADAESKAPGRYKLAAKVHT